MRKFRIDTVRIQPGFFIYSALMLLILPMHWIWSWLIATTLHEICHYIVLRIMGIRVFGIAVGLSGAKMETDNLTPFQELISAAAGPVGGLLLLLSRKHFPIIAVCGLIQSLFNLIPLYPLDGGRILRALIKIAIPLGKGVYFSLEKPRHK